MSNEINLDSIHNQLNQIETKIDGAKASFSWSKGRKFQKANEKAFTISEVLSELKKLNKVVEKNKPENDYGGKVCGDYLKAKRKIIAISESLQTMNKEKPTTKVRGLAIRRFFGIPAKIRSSKINSLIKNSTKSDLEIQEAVRKRYDAVTEHLLDFHGQYGKGLSEEKIQKLAEGDFIGTRDMGVIGRRIFSDRLLLENLEDILELRNKNAVFVKGLPENLRKLGELSAELHHKVLQEAILDDVSLDDVSTESLEELKAILHADINRNAGKLRSQIDEEKKLLDEIDSIRTLAKEYYPNEKKYEETKGWGFFGFNNAGGGSSPNSSSIEKFKFTEEEKALAKNNPKLDDFLTNYTRFSESKESNPAKIIFNLEKGYSRSELKEAFKSLALALHPDKMPPNLAEIGNRAFQALLEMEKVAKKHANG